MYLYVCVYMLFALLMVGYFHSVNWFCEKPETQQVSNIDPSILDSSTHSRQYFSILSVLNLKYQVLIRSEMNYRAMKGALYSSLTTATSILEICQNNTCSVGSTTGGISHFVSIVLIQAPLWTFQNLIVRSVVPPPEASKLCSKGHHAIAFTAAWNQNTEWVNSSEYWVSG